MTRSDAARTLLVVVLLGALVGGVGAWRYWLVPLELRSSAREAWWQLLPYGLILLLAITLLLRRNEE